MTPTPLTGTHAQNVNAVKKKLHMPDNEDIIAREFMILGKNAALFYVDGMASDDKLQHYVLEPCLHAPPLPKGTDLAAHLKQTVLPVGAVNEVVDLSSIAARILSGDAALICEGMPGALLTDVKGFVKRSVDKPANESVVMGPQEGFNGSLRDNVVLMRRILRSPDLISERVSIGNRVPTNMSVMYINGLARADVVSEVKRRIEGCNIDYVEGMGTLEQLMEDTPSALFPQVALTERPDRAASFLIEGQVLLLMENSPLCMALPISILNLLHAPDDTSMRWQYGMFLRLIRLFGILCALVLPALFISLTMHHTEAMPLSLLTSVLESQSRVPLSLFGATTLMLLVFSLINEAGTRVPGIMGNSLGIVSALILGQAAVDADLVSPLLIVTVALSGLGSYAVPDYRLSIGFRVAQLLLVFTAAIGGFLAVILILFIFGVRLCGLSSVGYPYMAPLTPARPANPDTVLRFPVWRQRLRGYIASPGAMERTKGRMRAWKQ